MIASSFSYSKLLSYFHFNFNTTDYFCASVIHLIRKYYIHISWKEGGRRGLGYGALHCSFTPDSHTSVGEKPGEQQFCNIITIFHIATTSQQGGRWEVCVCFQRESSESRERGERPKEKRRCSVLDPAGCGLLVKGDELGLRAAWHSLRRLLLCLLLLLRATRRSNLLVHGLLALHVRLLGGHIGVLSWQC